MGTRTKIMATMAGLFPLASRAMWDGVHGEFAIETFTESKPTRSNPPFCPYVESWLLDSFDLKAYPGKCATLAFLLGDKDRTLKFDGTIAASAFRDKAIKSGKDIVLSFGGATGTELAKLQRNVDDLAKAYVDAAKMYQAKRLDFDIEGGTTSDSETYRRRHAALKKVQAQLPDAKIQFTVPVMPSGLAADVLDMLKDAAKQGVKIDVVNVMAMDYGESFTGDMGKYAIDAATSTRKQLKAIGLGDVGIGVTPMILKNDVEGEVFSLDDGRELMDFAKKNKSWVRFVSFWAAGRDKDRSFGRLFGDA